MKKFSVLIVLLVSIVLTASAQLTLGPKIGVSVSKLSTNLDDIKNAARTGISFGAFVRFGDKTYLQPELIYNHKGTDLTQTQDGTDFTSELNIKTLDIPIMIGHKITGLPMGNIRVMGGPVASFILDKDLSISKEGFEESLDAIQLKNAIWGLQLGAGVDIMMFTLDVRYEIGLNDISDMEGVDFKSNSFQISLGWKIL